MVTATGENSDTSIPESTHYQEQVLGKGSPVLNTNDIAQFLEPKSSRKRKQRQVCIKFSNKHYFPFLLFHFYNFWGDVAEAQ